MAGKPFTGKEFTQMQVGLLGIFYRRDYLKADLRHDFIDLEQMRLVCGRLSLCLDLSQVIKFLGRYYQEYEFVPDEVIGMRITGPRPFTVPMLLIGILEMVREQAS